MSVFLNKSRDLLENGICVLDKQIDEKFICEARKTITKNINLFKKTRKYKYSGHLAGFHRFSQLVFLQEKLLSLPLVNEVIQNVAASSHLKTVGISDITINRSQEWHNDLLRGPYKNYLNNFDIWHKDKGTKLYKILLYMQSSKSLKFVKASHLNKIDLSSDIYANPAKNLRVEKIDIEKGSVVLIDLRLIHRGSEEDDFLNSNVGKNPKILVSTVLGDKNKKSTFAIEKGNSVRLKDWIERVKNYPNTELHTVVK